VPMLGRGRSVLTQIPGTVPNMAAPPPGCAFHPRCPSAGPRCSVEDPVAKDIAGMRSVACHYPLAAPGAAAEATAIPVASRAGS
jgi:oligopeptide/dipeptide ABC transporter ATP-binding protein